jgi:hypothetical protein
MASPRLHRNISRRMPSCNMPKHNLKCRVGVPRHSFKQHFPQRVSATSRINPQLVLRLLRTLAVYPLRRIQLAHRRHLIKPNNPTCLRARSCPHNSSLSQRLAHMREMLMALVERFIHPRVMRRLHRRRGLMLHLEGTRQQAGMDSIMTCNDI